MFLALAIQVTNYFHSVNKRVVTKMTWDTPHCFAVSEENFFKIGKCDVEREEIESPSHQFVRHFRLFGFCYCFGGR